MKPCPVELEDEAMVICFGTGVIFAKCVFFLLGLAVFGVALRLAGKLDFDEGQERGHCVVVLVPLADLGLVKEADRLLGIVDFANEAEALSLSPFALGGRDRLLSHPSSRAG